MVSNQQFRLKWNNHRNTVLQEFETLLHNNSFVDCIIGAEGKYLKAHKIILSACSPYLQKVFSEHFDKHPVILLKDVSYKELKCMIDYMYCGEVNISECELPSFLRTAQSLKIKGLAEDINEYDSLSDNEQPDNTNTPSFSENSRTVEANVEIRDEEGPHLKKSAPSLIPTNVVNSNFQGRKRKSPSKTVSVSGKLPNISKVVTSSTPNLGKLGVNVPSINSETENSNTVHCLTNENNVNKEENGINSKKSVLRNDPQEQTKSHAEVKEEPVDGDIDDDNSSYECINNPCDDEDPLNEDSESNCVNSGKNFHEFSIASNSSCNESDANDDDDVTFEIKEELITEVIDLTEKNEEHRIRVRSTTELMPLEEMANEESTSSNAQNNDYENKEIIIEFAESISGNEFYSSEINKSFKNDLVISEEITDGNDVTKSSDAYKNMKVTRSSSRIKCKRTQPDDGVEVKRTKLRNVVKGIRTKTGNVAEVKHDVSTAEDNFTVLKKLRKILPAPLPKSTLLPLSSSSTITKPTLKYVAQKPYSQTQDTTHCNASSNSSFKVITVPSGQQFCNTNNEIPQILCSTENDNNICSSNSLVLSGTPSSDVAAINTSDPISSSIIFLNSDGKVLLLNNSDMTVAPPGSVRTVSSVTRSPSNDLQQISYIPASNLMESKRCVLSKPIQIPSVTKFRKIAPLVKEPSTDNNGFRCPHCFKDFVEKNKLKKHTPVCWANGKSINFIGNKRRK